MFRLDMPPLKYRVVYNGQPIALVVAEEFEIARYAATLVHVEYEAEPGPFPMIKYR